MVPHKMPPEFLAEMKRATMFLRLALETIPNADGSGFLGGFLANVVGPIPDDQWKHLVMKSAIPCGRPGCRCEIDRASLFQALDNQRDEWREWIRGRGQNPDNGQPL